MAILNNIKVCCAFLIVMVICVEEAPAQEQLTVFSTYQTGDQVWMKYTDNSNAFNVIVKYNYTTMCTGAKQECQILK